MSGAAPPGNETVMGAGDGLLLNAAVASSAMAAAKQALKSEAIDATAEELNEREAQPAELFMI